jgi:hypothetical protein
MMRKAGFVKLIGLVIPFFAYALPLPQPIVAVPKKTVNAIKEKAKTTIVKKRKTYKLTNYKRYKLLSGEVFKYINAGEENTMWIDKVCYYEKDSEGKEKLIKCAVISVITTKPLREY